MLDMIQLAELAQEVSRQDVKHGPRFAAGTPLAVIRLAIACVEDEAKEAKRAWRKEKRALLLAGRAPGRPEYHRPEHPWEHTREELLQTAAVALRAVRAIDDPERP